MTFVVRICREKSIIVHHFAVGDHRRDGRNLVRILNGDIEIEISETIRNQNNYVWCPDLNLCNLPEFVTKYGPPFHQVGKNNKCCHAYSKILQIIRIYSYFHTGCRTYYFTNLEREREKIKINK